MGDLHSSVECSAQDRFPVLWQIVWHVRKAVAPLPVDEGLVQAVLRVTPVRKPGGLPRVAPLWLLISGNPVLPLLFQANWLWGSGSRLPCFASAIRPARERVLAGWRAPVPEERQLSAVPRGSRWVVEECFQPAPATQCATGVRESEPRLAVLSERVAVAAPR